MAINGVNPPTMWDKFLIATVPGRLEGVFNEYIDRHIEVGQGEPPAVGAAPEQPPADQAAAIPPQAVAVQLTPEEHARKFLWGALVVSSGLAVLTKYFVYAGTAATVISAKCFSNKYIAVYTGGITLVGAALLAKLVNGTIERGHL